MSRCEGCDAKGWPPPRRRPRPVHPAPSRRTTSPLRPCCSARHHHLPVTRRTTWATLRDRRGVFLPTRKSQRLMRGQRVNSRAGGCGEPAVALRRGQRFGRTGGRADVSLPRTEDALRAVQRNGGSWLSGDPSMPANGGSAREWPAVYGYRRVRAPAVQADYKSVINT